MPEKPEWRRLASMFEAASARWPQLESELVLWPEGDEPPDVRGQRGIGPREDAAGMIWVKSLRIGCKLLDSDGKRYRSGQAGMLVMRRHFGVAWGDPREVADEDEATACNDRLRYLARLAAGLLDSDAGGLSNDTMQWKGVTRWQLAVHELDPFNEREHLCDFFLASAATAERFASGSIAVVEAVQRSAEHPNDPRDAWIYAECCKGTQYRTIIGKLNRKPKAWERLASEQGVRQAAIKYAERHNLEPPARRK